MNLLMILNKLIYDILIMVIIIAKCVKEYVKLGNLSIMKFV